MAKSLLNSVNEILKRVGVIAGDSGLLTSLTDSARQPAIDIAIQVVNEGLDEVYRASHRPQPQEQAESTITLVTGTQQYALATDLVQLRWPMIDKTNTLQLFEFKGGYNDMLLWDPEQDDTGQPLLAAISPVNGKLHLDRAPTSDENGNVYTYQYDKDLVMAVAADTVPFSDAAFRGMVPAWVQLWKREMRNEFDGDLFEASIGRAAAFITQAQVRTSWLPR